MIFYEYCFLLLLLALLAKPLGIYIYHILEPKGKTFLDPVLKPCENWTYRFCRIDPSKEHTWKEYLFCILSFSLVSYAFVYVILRTQKYLPLNPEHFSNVSWDVSFNTAISFMTNTNWQSYAGEKTMSYFSQMMALTVQNFVSPAVGLCSLAALTRGLCHRGVKMTLGNFWVDITRSCYYLFLPLAIFFAIFLVSQGVPQNFSSYTKCQTWGTQKEQCLVQGPIASQEAIKILGSNGGGYTGANSSSPFENPTFLSNFLQILGILLIPAGVVYYFGKKTKNIRHGWALFLVMCLFLTTSTFICSHFEFKQAPIYQSLGIDTSLGNLEGKEMRFGTFNSVLFSTVTTSVSNGAVNSQLSSYNPIAALMLLLNMQTGEVIFGGVGSGLGTMVLYVVLTIFVVGLIIGRSPEYFRKKIESFDVKVCMLSFLIFFLVILVFTSLASITSSGLEGIDQKKDPHGFMTILYSFSSAAANNGSSFANLKTTPWYNICIGISMLLGRFLTIIPVLALAGSFAKKKTHPVSSSSFPISGSVFVFLVFGVILLMSCLTFIPASFMGPILEQFFMTKGVFF